MIKVVNEENGNLQSTKAKKILKRVKAAAMAFVITIGSMAGLQSAKAITNEEVKDAILDYLDEGFSWEYATMGEAVEEFEMAPEITFQEPEVVVEEPQVEKTEVAVQEPVIEGILIPNEEETVEEGVLIPDVEEPVVEGTLIPDVEEVKNQTGFDFDMKYGLEVEDPCDDCPGKKLYDEQLNQILGGEVLPEEVVYDEPISTEVVDEVIPEEVIEDEIVDEAIEIPDREEDLYRLDILVTDNYTGVAPVGFYREEKTLHNYGDASNDEEVRERASLIYNHLHRINTERGRLDIFNPFTQSEFSIDEIMIVIKYINGAYVANTGADAKYANDLWLEFVNAIRNDRYIIEDIIYKAGEEEEIKEDDLVKHENVMESFDFTLMLMGDSDTQPFMKWLGNKINEMYKATSREEAIRLFDEAYLAVMAITDGEGFVVDNVKYTISDFERPSDLILVSQILSSSIMRNEFVTSGYIMNKEFIGEEAVFLSNTLLSYNALCADEMVEMLKNGGVEVFESVVENVDGTPIYINNYAGVMQMKALGEAIANGEMGIGNYQNKYLNKYPEYLAIKDGTYDGSFELEPEYVYRKK